jgi:hypothetical protein
MRRDFEKYLVLIASITLLHQYQRVQHEEDGASYVTATLDDVELANRLAGEALGQSLDDLLPQTRQLLVLLDEYVTQRVQTKQMPRLNVRFTQRELREALDFSDRCLRRHLARLVELEYVLAFRTGQGNQRQYQLVYDGQGGDGSRFLLGLIDTSTLRTDGSDERTGGSRKRTGGSERQTGTQPAPIRRPIGTHSAPSKNGATAKRANELPRMSGTPIKNGQADRREPALS